MRQQLLVAFYEGSEPDLHGHYGQLSVDDDLYLIISGVLGVAAAGNPQPNRRQRMMRDLNHCQDWRLVYEVVGALWPQYHCRNRHDLYRTAVNRVLAMHGIAWDLGADGVLHRVLPTAAQVQVVALFEELAQPQLAGAHSLAAAAQEAYDARPRRDRDACSNMFDAMEEVAKVKTGLRGRPFGDVVTEMRRRGFAPGMADLLNQVNGLRNQTFGHGNDVVMNRAEVDFTYLLCVGGTLMFARWH